MTRPSSSIEYIEFDSKPLVDVLHLTPPPLLPAEPFTQLSYIEEHVRKLGCQTVLLEPHYIDRHYMEDHSILYSKNFLSLPNYCKRLHFFSLNATEIRAKLKAILEVAKTKGRKAYMEACINFSDSAYLGFCVIKPLEGSPVGRTTLRCYDKDAGNQLVRRFASIGTSWIHVAGAKLKVDGLPFQQQDIGVSACATTALWSSLQQSGAFEETRPATPAQITLLASQYALPFGKAMPNEGLSVDQMCQATQALGVPPSLIRVEENFEDARAHLHSATLSRFAPVLIIQLEENPDENHAVTVAGVKTDTSFDPLLSKRPDVDMSMELRAVYFHDDRIGPYVRATIGKSSNSLLFTIPFESGRKEEKWILTHILIPMHPKIRISFAGLREVAKRVVAEVAKGLRELLKAEGQLGSFATFPRIRFETRIERATDYVENLICEPSRMDQKEIERLVYDTALSRYVGTVMLQSESIGRIDLLVDTTSTINNINFLAVVVKEPAKYSDRIAELLNNSCRCVVKLVAP